MLKCLGVVGVVWLLGSVVALGQHLSYGVVAGTALTNDFESTYSDCCPGSGFSQLQTPAGKSAFIVGPMVEWNFLRHFSLEVNGLYRELHYNNLDPAGPRDGVVTWEFPILAKYRLSYYKLGPASVRPFVEAGPSFRSAGNLNQANPSHRGVTAGAGFEFPVRQVLIAPTLRYTRWGADSNFLAKSRPDQLELVVGFSRTAKSDRLLGTRLSAGAILGTNLLGDYNASASSLFFTVGAIDGTVLNEQEAFSSRSGPRSFLVGPELAFRLNDALSLEFDAIFRPVRQRYLDGFVVNGVTSTFSGSTSAITWQFPFVAKYLLPVPSLGRGTLKPFAEGGPSFRTVQTNFGFTVGVGVSFHYGRLTFAPRVRYTRWQANSSELKSDEANLLLGLTF